MNGSLYFLPAEIVIMTLIGTVVYLLIWRWTPREKENARRHNDIFYSLLLVLITGGASVFMLWLYRSTPTTKINIFSVAVLGVFLILLPLKSLADSILADRLALHTGFLTILFSGYIVFWGVQIASSQARMPNIHSGDVESTNLTALIFLVLGIVALIVGRIALRRHK